MPPPRPSSGKTGKRPVPASTSSPGLSTLHEARVVSSHGRHIVVESDDGTRRICHPRGKKNLSVVGDRVQWAAPPAGQGHEGTIEQILPRRNLFYRRDDMRTKAFAANLDQILILLAAEPEFSHRLLARALLAAEAAQIRPLIVLNKADLEAAHARGWERLAPYRAMGYPVTAVSLHLAANHSAHEDGAEALRMALSGHHTLVLGPSGTGKSTLVNLLVPGAGVQTGAISQALNSGRHTTTATHWYWVDRASNTAIIDSPGFQEFGLHHLAPAELALHMPDFSRHATACRFYNCSHLHEPGCAVLAQVGKPLDQGGIDTSRHRFYAELHAELGQSRY